MLVDRYFRHKSARVYGDVPSLLTAVMNVALLPSVAHDRKMREMVDLQFVPEVDNVGLLEWKRVDEVVQIGLKHARSCGPSGHDGLVRQLRRASLSAAVPAEPAIAPASDAPEPPSKTVIANTNKKTFHRPGCPSLNLTYDRNQKEFPDAEAAEAEGFLPCGRCKPTQPVAPPGTDREG